MRVVVADDSGEIRRSLSLLLDTVFETEAIGEAVDGTQAVAVVLERRPDVVVMDHQMPALDGLAASREILDRWPEAQILMNSACGDQALVDAAIATGVKGWVTKDLRPTRLIEAILSLGQIERPNR